MTTYNKATLKTFFQTGDVPTGTDYANFIDSYVNVVDTATQSMAGALNPTELITPRVSATNVNVTGTLTVAGIFSATNLVADSVVASAHSGVTGSFSGIVSAGTVNTTTVSADAVYCSAVRSVNGVIAGSGIVSAAGTTQATAAILSNVINRGKGVVDGTTTGFAPLANRAGLVQYLLNEGPSANLWPPTGGFINGLAVNTPFPLVASAAYTIFHITASSYGVK